jgi:hypothetical protein
VSYRQAIGLYRCRTREHVTVNTLIHSTAHGELQF